MNRHRFVVASALFALASAVAGAQLQTLTQNVNNTMVTPTSGLICGAAGNAANGWMRSYDLAALPGPIDIVGVTFGCVNLTGPAVAAEVRLLIDPTPPTIAPYAGLTPLHVEPFTVTGDHLGLATVWFNGPGVTVNPTDTVVVEIYKPVTTTVFYVGGNAGGQTADAFLMAPACGAAEPVTPTSLGSFPNAQFLIDVHYVPAGTTKPYPGTFEDLQLWSRVGTTGPLTGGWAGEIKTGPGGEFLTLKFASPQGTFDLHEAHLLVEPFVTGFPPLPVFPGVNMSLGGMIFLMGGVPDPLFGPLLLPPGGLAVTIQIPPILAGVSALFQGIVVWVGGVPSPVNGIFAATHGHEIQFL